MKEDIKDMLYHFGIAFLLWALLSYIHNPIVIFVLGWVLKIGIVIFLAIGTITAINIFSAWIRGSNENKSKEK